MARPIPISQPDHHASPQPGDWQALRGELVALLDQVGGQYAQAGASDPAYAGFAQRMHDLKYQVADVDPDNRHREALRSVKRQIERFNERDEAGASADDVLQSAIQQIRARTQGAPAVRESRLPSPAPARTQSAAPARPPVAASRFDDLANSMVGLSGRLSELESELKLQRGNASQVREIADQVSQLSQVVELLAGAVGETGQVKRLESQITGLAQLIGQAPKPDMTLLTDRLDQLSATVDRLADLQVQQIRHVVREAEFGAQTDTARGMQAVEAGVRSIYDRLDALEANLSVSPVHLERISAAMGEITARLGSDSGRPERLLGLVDALNGRVNEIEDRGDALGGLRDDLEGLRTAMLGAIEPRFAAIEAQIGQIDERLQNRGGEAPGLAQLEAQIRQLVARMDQTGEQLSGLARLYSSDERQAGADFEALANLAATRTLAQMPQAAPAPDYDRIANLVAARTAEAVAKVQQSPVPDFDALADKAVAKAGILARTMPASGRMLSEAGLAEFEARMTRLVDGLARTRPPEGVGGVTDGVGRVEERLAVLEAAMGRRPSAQEQSAAAQPGAKSPTAAPTSDMQVAPRPTEDAARDAMPRSPSAEAPLKEFGFPDLGPVRAALEAKNGPRKLHPSAARRGDEIDPGLEIQPITPEMAGGGNRPKPSQPGAEAPPLDFDPTRIVRPPRPESSLDAAVDRPRDTAAIATPRPAPTPAAVEVPASSRNTFIEAARRAAQRQNQSKSAQADTNSLIGRAFARFQPGEAAAEKSAAKVAIAPVAPPEPLPPERAAEKPSLLSRLTGKAAGPKAAKPPAEAPTPAPEPAQPGPRESFLVRNRRPILLTASLVAVSFMALNLAMQRMAAHDQSAPPAAADTSVAPADADPATQPAPASTSAAPAAKPVSEIAPPTTSAAASLTAAKPAPRVISMTDPVTTASIDPGEALSFTPSPADSRMPAPLAPPASVATPSGSDGAASAPVATPTPLASAAPVAAANAAPGTAVSPAPAMVDSPVKVELPPDSLGSLDLRQAAADGDARAQFEIAAVYSEGRAVPQDFKQAAVWYERAAAQGFGPAQYRLGNLYENGKGVAKDYEQARLWYQRAAEAGNRMAMHNLAALYAGGQFGKQDFASASEWFERAANLGMKDSQFNLGMLYARGLGVTQNMETSYKWFALAASDNDKDAAKARDDVARSLDAAVVKRLEGEVAAWKPAQIDLAANFAPIGTWETNFNPGPAIADKGVVSKVQAALVRLGFDVGQPNGRVGPKTSAAIKAFEQGTGMSQVGAINPRLLAVLGSQPV